MKIVYNYITRFSIESIFITTIVTEVRLIIEIKLIEEMKLITFIIIPIVLIPDITVVVVIFIILSSGIRNLIELLL